MAHRIVKKSVNINSQMREQPVSEMPHYQDAPQTKSDAKIPRPIIPSTDDIYQHDKSSFRKGRTAFPPAQSLFISENTYDAGPDFVRPTSAVMLGNPKKTQFPFGAWITPFGSEKVHTVRVKGPLRCSRCKAYVNAHFRLDGGKTSAICNICGISFQIDPAIDQTNLTSSQIYTEGVIDFVVQDKRFMRKRLDIIKIIIAIQIGHFVSESGAFQSIIQSIKAAVENTQFEPNIRIGVLFYSAEGINFVKIRNSEDWSSRPPIKYQVKYSTTGLCCPLSDKQMLLNPNQQKDKLTYLLDYIGQVGDQYYRNSKYASFASNYGQLLHSLLQNFVKQTGRIIVFSHTTPRAGLYGIRPHTSDDLKQPLKPLSNDYYQLARKFVDAKVGIDLFLIAKQHLVSQQLSTVHYLSSLTGGSTRLYCPFNANNHGQNLYYEIYGCLSRKYVYDVDFTARVSNGLNIASFGAYEGIRETRDITLSMMNPASSIMFTFEHQQKIDENGAAFLQYAMMFTNGSGQRRLRIINYRYLISNKVAVLHEACDYLAVSNLILREAISKTVKGDPVKIRQDVINRLVNIITQYAQEAKGITKPSMFMAHSNFAPALAYINSVINGKLFLSFHKVTADYRIYEMMKLNQLNFGQFANQYYPKLYSLGMEIYDKQPVPGQPIDGKDDIEQSTVLPPNLPLCHQSLSKDGVFLQMSSDYLLILVMPEASSDLLIEIFGTDNWQEIQTNGLPELQTAHNIRITLMVEELRRRNSRDNGIFLPIIVRTPKRKGPFNQLVSMVTKQDTIECKYFAFLDTIHRHVQLKLK